MAQAAITEENIQQGKVQQVCKEWLIRQDSAIAHRIQSEEFNHHYEGNRFKNRIFRSDREKAKYLQEQEEFEKLMKQERQKDLLALEDEQIARTLQQEEANQAHLISRREAEDARLAQKLQEKEKERIKKRRLQKELLQVEKIRLEKFGSTNPHLLLAVSRTIADIERREAEPSCSSSSACGSFDPDESLGYLSEFCVKPSDNLTEAELKVFQAEQDEELARFLQQYEAKSKAATSIEKRQLIEAQDYEIAKILQEGERLRVKKLKEKRRQKLKQANSMVECSVKTVDAENETHQYPADIIRHQRSVSDISYQDSEASFPPSAIDHEQLASNGHNGCCENVNEITVEEQSDTTSESSRNPTRRALPPIPTFHNVAMDLDPTYKRKIKSKSKSKIDEPQVAPVKTFTEASSTASNTDPTGLHFAQFCRVTPSPTKQTSAKNASTLPKTKSSKNDSQDNDSDTYPDYDNNTLPAILPVQGQRRTSTVEKRKQKAKEHCRPQ